MKRIIFLLVLCCALPAFSQVRFDLGAPGGAGVVSVSGSGQPFLIAQPGVSLQFCAYPANAIPCSNFAPTFNDLTLSTQCANDRQIVLQGSSTCVPTGDAYGNLGVYTNAGTYQYTLTIGTTSYGPFTVTLGGGGGGGGSTVQGTVNQINASVSNPQILSLANPTSFPGAVTIPFGTFTLSGSSLGQGFSVGAGGLLVQNGAPIYVNAFTVGADWCAKLITGAPQLPSSGNGVIDMRGLGSGAISPACSSANAHALGAALLSGFVILPNGTLYLPMTSGSAAVLCQAPHATTYCTPRGGVVQLNNKFTGFRGQGRGDVGQSIGTSISYCTGSGAPVTGCVGPETSTYAISSTTVTYAGGRTYIGFNVAAQDLVPGEFFRVFGSATATNDQNFEYRVCAPDSLNSTRNDASCPADPTATLVYAPAPNSGVTKVTISGSGSGYTGPCVISGGGGSGATCSATIAAGNVTAITITDPGSGYTSAPTLAVTGGSGQTFTAKIIAACASSCGTLAKEIPMFDLTPLQQPGAGAVNNYAQRLENMALDGGNLNGASGLRSTTGNEHSGGTLLKFARFPERAISVYTFHAQNGDTFESIEVLSGSGAGCSNCTVGTVGFAMGEVGTHGMNDWTVNFGNSTVTHGVCVALDTQTDPVVISNGHCENGQKVILMGAGAPAQGITLLGDAGGPSGNCANTGCVPLDGPFQNGTSSVVTVVPNYVTGTPFTRDYLFLGLMRVNQTNIIEDWVNTNPTTGLHNISNNNSMMFYTCDAVSVGNIACLTSDPNLTSVVPNFSVTGTVTAATVATTGSAGLIQGATIVQSSTASNTDFSGQLTMSGGTNTYSFTGTYVSHPECVASDQTNIAAVKVTYTGVASVTFTTAGATDVVNYVCGGRN